MLSYFDINTCIVTTVSGVSDFLMRRETLRLRLVFLNLKRRQRRRRKNRDFWFIWRFTCIGIVCYYYGNTFHNTLYLISYVCNKIFSCYQSDQLFLILQTFSALYSYKKESVYSLIYKLLYGYAVRLYICSNYFLTKCFDHLFSHNKIYPSISRELFKNRE